MVITEEYIQKYLSWKSPTSRLKKGVRRDILDDRIVYESEAYEEFIKDHVYKKTEVPRQQ